MAFFIPFLCVTLFQFFSITSPVLFKKNKKLWKERREDFLYGCFSLSRYIKGDRKSHL